MRLRRAPPPCAAPMATASWPPIGSPLSAPRATAPSAIAAWRSCAHIGRPTSGSNRTRARGRRREFLRARGAAAERLEAQARGLAQTLGGVRGGVANRVEALEAELAADRAAGEGVANELRACARLEAEIQAHLRDRGEEVT